MNLFISFIKYTAIPELTTYKLQAEINLALVLLTFRNTDCMLVEIKRNLDQGIKNFHKNNM